MRGFICHLVCCIAATALAAEASEEGASVPEPAGQLVKKEPFKIEVALEGVLEARRMREVILRPTVWSTLTVLKAVEHGSQVNEGDLLISLETEKIDKAIADLRDELRLADLAIERAEHELKFAQKTTALNLAAGERAKRQAEQDLKIFLETGRSNEQKSAARSELNARNSLTYQLEELRQLEKMYKADDLTEETEEIILKRTRDTVERLKFYLEQATYGRDQTLKVKLPRQQASLTTAAERSRVARDRAAATLPLDQKKRQLELAAQKRARSRSAARLEKLRADRALLNVKAPASGIVYYGACDRGTWKEVSSFAQKLRRGGSLMPGTVVMTIVKTRPMFLRVTVPEKQLQYVRPGLRGTARPTGYPEVKLPVSVNRVDAIPSGPGVFGARLAVVLNEEADALMPGMTCGVKFSPYVKKEAISVPNAAVCQDTLDEEKHYVYVIGKDGKPKKRRVTVGKRTADLVEIVKGLADGERILPQCPGKKK